MKNLKWIAVIAMFFLAGCNNDGDTDGVVKSVSSRVDSNNSLRVTVSTQFTQPTEYRIEYYKASDNKSVYSTKTYSPSGSDHSATLVFLEPGTDYKYRIMTRNGVSAEQAFTTGSIPGDMPMFTVESGSETKIPGYILFDKAEPVTERGAYIIVTNTDGTVVWYEPVPRGVKVVNFDEKTNTFTALTGANGATSNDKMAKYTAEYIQVMDLFGNVVLKKDVKDLFLHHDARRLPNGDLIALSFFSKKFDLSAIGGERDAQVIGDGFTIIGIDGEVKKRWDFFEEGKLDPSLDPKVISETGRIDDWIHANSVNFDEAGNYYMTSRDLPGLWKINGKSWEIEYHVASEENWGDVEMESKYYADGLHSAYPLSADRVLVLDNGKITKVTRALIYNVNAKAKTAGVDLEIVFPEQYHSKLGSNAKIIGDDLMIYGARNANTVVFTDLRGNIIRTVAVPYPIHRAEFIRELKY